MAGPGAYLGKCDSVDAAEKSESPPRRTPLRIPAASRGIPTIPPRRLLPGVMWENKKIFRNFLIVVWENMHMMRYMCW